MFKPLCGQRPRLVFEFNRARVQLRLAGLQLLAHCLERRALSLLLVKLTLPFRLAARLLFLVKGLRGLPLLNALFELALTLFERRLALLEFSLPCLRRVGFGRAGCRVRGRLMGAFLLCARQCCLTLIQRTGTQLRFFKDGIKGLSVCLQLLPISLQFCPLPGQFASEFRLLAFQLGPFLLPMLEVGVALAFEPGPLFFKAREVGFQLFSGRRKLLFMIAH
jgi:hypothetical protein